MDNSKYVHGYAETEQQRLLDQANALTDLLHSDTSYSPGARVLEAGCGVGAQTAVLAARSPAARFTSLDIAPASLALARQRTAAAGLRNIDFLQADLFHLPFPDEHFDHIFICFILEHLTRPTEALAALRRVLRPGGTITAIEGDHGSAYFHPDSPQARRTLRCLIDLQAAAGGDSLIGRRLYPLLAASGYCNITVSPRMVYVDGSRPDLARGFTEQTFTAMVAGVRDEALARRLIDAESWQRGIADLYRTAEPDGVFCYTFFKGIARKKG